jgi:hypothetical protein
MAFHRQRLCVLYLMEIFRMRYCNSSIYKQLRWVVTNSL